MDILIKPAFLRGTAPGISSKSYVQRALVCAALADGCSHIICNNFCDDIMTAVGCLRRLGADISVTDSGFDVTGIRNFPEHADIDCKDSGTALRFFLPLLAVNGCTGKISVSASLANRPVKELSDALTKNGADIYGLEIKRAGITGYVFEIPGNISSQYISGLLLALPLCAHDSEIRLTSPLQSAGYVEITIKTAESFGIRINKTSYGYTIPGNQRFSPCRYTAESDWSSAAYWFSLGCDVSGLSNESIQPDSVFPHIMDNSVVNAENMPDIVPALAAYASVRPGTTIIEGTDRLKYKESNRIISVVDSLSSIGADISYADSRIFINGKSSLSGGTAQSFGDHRIVMMIAASSPHCTNDVVIKDAGCVTKSYPSFFETFNMLGGNAHVI